MQPLLLHFFSSDVTPTVISAVVLVVAVVDVIVVAAAAAGGVCVIRMLRFPCLYCPHRPIPLTGCSYHDNTRIPLPHIALDCAAFRHRQLALLLVISSFSSAGSTASRFFVVGWGIGGGSIRLLHFVVFFLPISNSWLEFSFNSCFSS